jgi:hypothetical protein
MYDERVETREFEKLSHSGNQLAQVRGNPVEHEEEQKKKKTRGGGSHCKAILYLDTVQMYGDSSCRTISIARDFVLLVAVRRLQTSTMEYYSGRPLGRRSTARFKFRLLKLRNLHEALKSQVRNCSQVTVGLISRNQAEKLTSQYQCPQQRNIRPDKIMQKSVYDNQPQKGNTTDKVCEARCVHNVG